MGFASPFCFGRGSSAGLGFCHGFIPPAQGFPQPHVPEQLWCCWRNPGAFSWSHWHTSALDMGKSVSGKMETPQGHTDGSGTGGRQTHTHKEPALLCLVAPSVNSFSQPGINAGINHSSQQSRHSSLATAGGRDMVTVRAQPSCPPLRDFVPFSWDPPAFQPAGP